MGNTNNLHESSSSAKDILLEDYRYLSDSFWKNEQGGETRVNLYIGIVTLLIGAMAAIITSEKTNLDESAIRLTVMIFFLVLLLLGVITMFRMLMRNENTDRCKRGLDTIRQLFMDYFDNEHVLTGYYPVKNPQEKEKGWQLYKKEMKPRRIGGLTHTVAAINSFLFTGIIGVMVYPIPIQNSTIMDHAVVIGVFVVSLIVQIIYISYRDVTVGQKLRADDPTHAVGVVYSKKDDIIKYLIIRPKKKTEADEWVLPKGHIQFGEWHAEAALREIHEETGVVAQLICLIGSVKFKTPGEAVYAKFYLMRDLFTSTPIEERNPKWCSFDDALSKLTYDESKYILKEAEKRRILAEKLQEITTPSPG